MSACTCMGFWLGTVSQVSDDSGYSDGQLSCGHCSCVHAGGDPARTASVWCVRQSSLWTHSIWSGALLS